MPGLLERIKDWLGILDDADDFIERSVKVRSNLDRIISLVIDGGEFLQDRLKSENLRQPSDFNFITSFVQSTADRKGELLKLLAQDVREVDNLLAKAKSAGIKAVVPVLQSLKSDIAQTIVQHRDVFQELDLVIRAWSKIRRGENIRAVARVVLGAVISLTSAAVVMHTMNNKVKDRLTLLEAATGLARKETPVEGN